MRIQGLVVAFVALLVAVAISADPLVSWSKPSAAFDENDAPSNSFSLAQHIRHYDLGISYVPASRINGSLEDAYDKIAQVADVAYIQGGWDEMQNALSGDVAIARKHGLKIYLALDILTYVPPRQKIKLPPFIKSNTQDFTDPSVRAAYHDLVVDLARKHQPDYYVVLVEGSSHKDRNPDSFAAFSRMYPAMVADVRKVSPKSKIGLSIIYNFETNNPSVGQALFAQHAAELGEMSDFLAVSTYPFFMYRKPANFPITFLSDLAASSKKPLFISETSWCTSEILPLFRNLFETTPQAQAKYFKRLCESAKLAQEKGYDIEAINCTTLVDPPQTIQQILATTTPMLNWFNTLGVMYSLTKPKPAFDVLQKWKSLPHS